MPSSPQQQPPTPGFALAVVRQDQISAWAVVPAEGVEWSLLLAPDFRPRHARPRTGDLVAVQDGVLVYLWQRALVLRVTADGVRVRLPDGAQATLPASPVLPDAAALRPGEAVFADAALIFTRAWPWYEPVVPAAVLDFARLTVDGEQLTVDGATGDGET